MLHDPVSIFAAGNEKTAGGSAPGGTPFRHPPDPMGSLAGARTACFSTSRDASTGGVEGRLSHLFSSRFAAPNQAGDRRDRLLLKPTVLDAGLKPSARRGAGFQPARLLRFSAPDLDVAG
jgi:hypothetical protein